MSRSVQEHGPAAAGQGRDLGLSQRRPVPACDISLGDYIQLGSVRVTLDEIVAFATVYDPLPMHIDPDAAAVGPFGGIIASGAHTIAIFSSLSSRGLGGVVALHAGKGIDRLRLPHPVRPDSQLTGRMEVVEVMRRAAGDAELASGRELAEVRFRSTMTDQDGHVVLAFTGVQVVRWRSEA